MFGDMHTYIYAMYEMKENFIHFHLYDAICISFEYTENELVE